MYVADNKLKKEIARNSWFRIFAILINLCHELNFPKFLWESLFYDLFFSKNQR